MLLTTVDYSTFLGGNALDSAFAVAADSAGNTYLTGTTASASFPTTAGAFDRSLNGIYDAFVAKFRPDGSLDWSTYLGGDGDERGHGIAVDTSGVYITGRTDSANFPVEPGSFDTTLSGAVDAFVAKLSADGATLLYSTYLGGTGSEIDEGFDKLARRIGAIAVDADGNAYITGSTTSSNFPTTVGASRTTSGGFNEVFVTKLNATGSALVYSTYLGGSDHDRGYGIAVDTLGHVYVTGETVSLDFPTTPNTFQPTKGGGFSDSFITKLNPTGTVIEYSSYLGGSGSEFPGRLALDGLGQVYLTGATASFDFPITAGAFQTAKASNGIDAYVVKVNANGTGLVYSTYLGGTFGNDSGEAIAVDSGLHAYVIGETDSGAFPVKAAFQPTKSGLADAFIAKLNASGSELVYSSYLGGSRNDSGYGVAVDANRVVHAVGQTMSSGINSTTPFPTTTEAIQPASGGVTDVFVALISSEQEPSLSIADATRVELHDGTTQLEFRVNLSVVSSQAVTVAYATTNGTATAGSDYQATSGELIIPAGELTGSIIVLVNGDRIGEQNETFFVNLNDANNAAIHDGNAVGTILDDEPRIMISDVTKKEANKGVTKFVFTVKLSATYDQPVTMSFKTADGTATSGDNDYVAKAGTLTFKPGERTKTITIEVNGDKKWESNEVFYLDLFGKRGNSNSVFTKKRGIGTIVNDDWQRRHEHFQFLRPSPRAQQREGLTAIASSIKSDHAVTMRGRPY